MFHALFLFVMLQEGRIAAYQTKITIRPVYTLHCESICHVDAFFRSHISKKELVFEQWCMK